jgi:hypothetical protein
VADTFDKQIDYVSAELRKALGDVSWIPTVAKPAPKRPPPVAIVSVGYYERAEAWVRENKALTAALVVGSGAAIYYVYRKKKNYGKKRRARRASNGARREVVGKNHHFLRF